MAQIHNTDLLKEVREGIKSQQLRENIPQMLADKIVPVMEVNPKLLRRTNLVKNITKASSGSQTIFTSDATKETYITNLVLSVIKDATNDAVSQACSITVVQDGATLTPLSMSLLTLTAQDDSITLSFKNPIKIDKNTVVGLTSVSYTAGTMFRSANVIGYTLDNPNA